MPDQDKTILIIVLVVLMAFVVFFELRVMRGKSKDIRRVSIKKDEAYNAILTTRSVLNAMQNQGRKTGSASQLLARAKEAMQSGDYEKASDLCEKARTELVKPTERKLRMPETPAAIGSDEETKDSLEEVAVNILSESPGAPASAAELDSYKGAKLEVDRDGNYMGAKFEIATAKGDVNKAVNRGLDASSAKDLLSSAETAFEDGKYSKALSLAIKARKAVSSEAASETIPLRARRAKEAPVAEEPEPEETPAAESASVCQVCGEPLEMGDIFCAKCGAKVPKERKCPTCGTKPRMTDMFCRKCGAKLG